MKKIFSLLAGLFLALAAMESLAQARLVINGSHIVLSNGATMVLKNAATDAITSENGGITTTGPTDKLIWHTDTVSGTYTVPFISADGTPVPTKFTKTAGTGNGYYILATYATPTWQNSLYLPAGILHVSDKTETDLSEQILDRFWEISAAGYTVKPELTNLTFTYTNTDYTASGNAITEEEIKPMQWNSDAKDWRNFSDRATLNTEFNNLTIDTVAADQQFSYWIMSGTGAVVLPVHFISFTANANGTKADLVWATATEENNDYFVVERSANGRDFSEVTKVKGAGTTAYKSTYFTTDATPLSGISYYRIKQVDFDGKFSFSATRSVRFAGEEPTVNLFPNPATTYQMLQLVNWQNQNIRIHITDLQGRVLLSRQTQIKDEGSKTIRVDFPQLPSGTYFITITGTEKVHTQKQLIHH